MKLTKFIWGICISLLSTFSVSAQCNTNVSICTPGLAGPFNFVAPGAGVSTCLDWIGPNTGYIILNITTSGPLNMLIDGNSGVGFLDVAVFDIPPGVGPCAAITNNANQIGCNYASASSGCNQFGAAFPCPSQVPAPNVVAGQNIMIVVENWSGASANFTMQLGPLPGAQTGPPNPAITPVGPFCTTNPPLQLQAADMGGTWAGPGVSASGMFNPAAAGVGTHVINYSIGTAPCNAASTTTITVGSVPNVNPVAPISVCAGTNVPLTTFTSAQAGVQFNWTNSNTSIGLPGAGNGALPAFTAVNLGTTTQTASITVTPSIGSCVGTPQTFTITVNPRPTALVPANSVFCAGAIVPVSAFSATPAVAGTTFSWTNSNTASGLGANGTGNAPSFTSSNSSAVNVVSTISVIATSASGCPSLPVNFTITVTPGPTMTDPINLVACSGNAVPATIFTSTPAGATFSWVNSNTTSGLAANGAGNQTGFISNGAIISQETSTITVTPSIGACLGAPQTYTITINPVPNAIVPANASYCPGTIVPESVFTSNIVGANLSWTNSNTATGLGAAGVGNAPSFTGTNPGGASIVSAITVTPSLNGCVGSPSNFSITITNGVTMADPLDVVVCNGNLVNPSAFTSVPAGATYSWNNSNTSIGLASNGIGNQGGFSAVNLASTQVVSSITVTPSIGLCIGTPQTYTISVNPTPTMNDPIDLAECPGNPVPSTIFSSGFAGATYSWVNSNTASGLPANGSGDQTSFVGINSSTAAVVSSITVTPTVLTCVGNPQTYSITITPAPSVVVPANVLQCAGPVAVIDFTPSISGASLAWTNSNINSGMPLSGAGDIPVWTSVNTTSAPIVSAVTVTPILGTCIGTPSTMTVTINPIPQLFPTTNSPVCEGSPLNLATSGPAGASYNWTGPLAFSAAVQNGTIPSPTANQSGTYTVTATQFGCVNSANVDVTINPSIIPQIAPIQSLCANASAVLLAAIPGGGIWSGIGITNPSTGQFTPDLTLVGNQTITYTVAALCSVPATAVVVINPLPLVQFSAPDLSGCSPFAVTFTDNSLPLATSSIWNFGDGQQANNTGSVTHTFTSDNCYDISLTNTSAAGCTSTQTLTNYICALPNAIASFNLNSDELNVLDPIITTSNTSSNADLYNWDFGDGNGSNIENPVHAYPVVAGNYVITLIANNVNNCPDTTQLSIRVRENLIYYVPNSFTPDGDEFNNVFKPILTSGLDPLSYTLTIYNRWGEVLFESLNIDFGWDGTYHAEPCKEGTYVYTIKFKDTISDKKFTYEGHVNLFR